MDTHQHARLGWIELYGKHKEAGLVCCRCGISRPTLRKWLRRYQALGVEGLKDTNKRSHAFPTTKVTPDSVGADAA